MSAGLFPKARVGMLGVALLLVAGSVRAQVVFSDVAKSLEYQQTAPNTVVPFNGGMNAFFYARNFYDDPADFDGGELTFPGPASPQAYNISGFLDCCGHNGRGFQSDYMTPAALDAAFPSQTTYSLTATNSVDATSQSVDIAFGADLYPSTTPELTPASFAALQAADPSVDLTIAFNNFARVAGANVAQGFFTIYDYTSQTTVFNDAGFAPDAGSVQVGARALTAGDSYVFELIFDSADYGNGGGNQDDGVAYRSDLRTLGYFTVPSSVPEPASWAMLLVGLGVVGGAYRGQRSRLSAA